MFDLSMSQQMPAAALIDPAFRQTFIKSALIILEPFKLEAKDDFPAAIEAHKRAVQLIEAVTKPKNMRKFNRKMFERQAAVHKERINHLSSLGGNFAVVVKVPSQATQPDPSSYARSEPLSDQSFGVEPIEYVLSTDSELVDLGVRSMWYFVKDRTNTHTIYAAQGISDLDRPLIEVVLRRPDEFFPYGGAIHVALLKQANQNFKFRMQRRNGDEVWETPDSTNKKKDWSPRRFSYGGRHFVWRNEEGKDSGLLSKKWAFETLYEVKDSSEGSEVVGNRLFWGRIHGGGKAKWSLYLVPGLDPYFQEHILASQLARMMRWTCPPDKDLAGVERGVATVGAIGAVVSLSQLLG